jgi:hypothetical protein
VPCAETPFSVVLWLISWHGELAGEIKMLNKTERSDRDRAPNENEKPENCYCEALPKGSGLCLPCYTQWLRGASVPAPAN